MNLNSMNETPMSSRMAIGLFGKRNAGKSSLINALTDQSVAVISDVAGTTTDPVYKTMELLPIGRPPMIGRLVERNAIVDAVTRSIEGSRCEVVTAEFKTNFMRPAIGARFLAVGRVQNAGRMLTVCTGEVRAFAGDGPQYKLVALMQATMVSVPANA